MTAKPYGYDSAAWGMMPNITRVSADLSEREEDFMRAVGRLLSDSRQTDRFAVTLLHSHFDVKDGEFLGEKYNIDASSMTTSVYSSVSAAAYFQNLVPRSWYFPKDDVELFIPLTYIDESDLPQKALHTTDHDLIARAKKLYLAYGVSDRFGMSHPGKAPPVGKLWVEEEDVADRYLFQEQLPSEDVVARNPIRTMWVFDSTGKHIIVMGCCLKYTSNMGHTGRIHPRR